MKNCPLCDITYSDDSNFCSHDRAHLVSTTCGKCGGIMKRGFLYHPHASGLSGDMRGLTWIEGDTPGESIMDVRERGAIQYRVTTYRCQKCGYVEVYALEPQDDFCY